MLTKVKHNHPSSAIKNYRVHFEKMVTAIYAIENSDLIVNVLAKKLNDKNLKEILKNEVKLKGVHIFSYMLETDPIFLPTPTVSDMYFRGVLYMRASINTFEGLPDGL